MKRRRRFRKRNRQRLAATQKAEAVTKRARASVEGLINTVVESINPRRSLLPIRFRAILATLPKRFAGGSTLSRLGAAR